MSLTKTEIRNLDLSYYGIINEEYLIVVLTNKTIEIEKLK